MADSSDAASMNVLSHPQGDHYGVPAGLRIVRDSTGLPASYAYGRNYPRRCRNCRGKVATTPAFALPGLPDREV